MLSAVDKQNVALFKSFESDMASKLVERGPFEGGGMVLTLVDLEHAEVADTGGDRNEWDRKERRWTARGDWVITWDAPGRAAAAGRHGRLHRVLAFDTGPLYRDRVPPLRYP